MAKAFSVFVNIGGKLNASLKNAVNQAQAQVGRLRNIPGVSAIGRGISSVGASVADTRTRLAVASKLNQIRLDEARGNFAEATVAAYGFARALRAPIKAAADFESSMSDVRKVVDFPTPDAFKAFQNDVINMSKRLPMAASDLSKIVAAAGQSGIARDDLLAFTEMAAKVGVAFDISADQAGDAMAKLKTGLGLTIPQVGLLADAMNKLSNEQASSAADILDVVRRVGASGKQFGFTGIQVAAFGSAMLSAGAESDVAATSFRNMGKALTKGEAATKGQRQAYAKLGMNAKRVARNMQKDAVGTTVKVMEALAKLPKEQQAAYASMLFGDEARALPTLLTNLKLLKDSLGMVDDEQKYAGSSAQEYAVRAQTFSNNVQLFNNRLTALGIRIGNALLPPLTRLMDKLGPIVDRIADFAEANPKLTSSLVGLTAGLIGLRLATTGLRWLGLFGKGTLISVARGALAATAGLGGLARGMGLVSIALAGGVAGRLRMFAAGLVAIAGAGNARAILGTAATSFGALALAVAKFPLGILSGVMRGLLVGLRFAAIGGFIGAIVAALAALGVWVANNWEGLKTFFSAFGDSFVKGLGPGAAQGVKAISDALGSAFDWVTKLLGPIDETGKKWAEWGSTVGGAVAGGVNAVANAIERVIGLMSSAVEKAAAMGNAIASALNLTPGAGLGGANQKGPPTSPAGIGLGGAPAPAGNRARAVGGPVTRGLPYLVGERGPEIFTPAASGRIDTNGALRALTRAGSLASAGMPSSSSMAAAAAATARRSGDISISNHFTINGAQDPNAIAREVERGIARAMQRAEADQRALLSD